MEISPSNPLLSVIISVVFFIIGFVIISKLMDYFQNKKFKQDERKPDGRDAEGGNEQDSTWKQNYEEEKYENKEEILNPEIKYKAIFGFIGPYTKDDVRKRYKELMKKYHPDKVQHLGKEFHVIAEEKTKMIQEAYEYFKATYNIKD